ncbi:hypothetical protein EIQ27_06255 [Xanthomonas campestris pv. armoraciae]
MPAGGFSASVGAAARPGLGSSARQTSCLTRRRGTSLCRSPPIPGHAAALARRWHELADR